jgi:hypothetical protein
LSSGNWAHLAASEFHIWEYLSTDAGVNFEFAPQGADLRKSLIKLSPELANHEKAFDFFIHPPVVRGLQASKI